MTTGPRSRYPAAMKLRALALVVLGTTQALVLVQACASDDSVKINDTTSAGGSGAGTTTGTGGSTGGAGGSNPVAADCATLCGYLDSIDCKTWPNCATECPSMFNAPPDCADEFAEMLSCWVGHETEFQCTDTQLLPPAACKDKEDAFNACFKGTTDGGTDGGGCICQGCQVCSGDQVTSCACRTGCPANQHEYSSVCAPSGAEWTCSCYDKFGDTQSLLGTCSVDAMYKCDNFAGCCAPYFLAAQGN